MITELIQDLISKINTIPELAGRVGAQVGGTTIDSASVGAPTPNAWVIFSGMSPINQDENGRKYFQAVNSFVVVVQIDYGSDLTEQDFIGNSLKLIEDVAWAVHSSEYINSTGAWELESINLDSIFPTKLLYHIGFSAMGYKSITPNIL